MVFWEIKNSEEVTFYKIFSLFFFFFFPQQDIPYGKSGRKGEATEKHLSKENEK